MNDPGVDATMDTDEEARRRESRELGQRSNKGPRPLSRTIRWLKRIADGSD